MTAETTTRPRSRKALAWSGGAVAVVALTAILFAFWDWNWFRGPVASIMSARMHRQVTITGNLRVHPWSWQPSATLEGVHIANPAWAGKTGFGDIDRIAVQIRLGSIAGKEQWSAVCNQRGVAFGIWVENDGLLSVWLLGQVAELRADALVVFNGGVHK